jgi:hypothetical protein
MKGVLIMARYTHFNNCGLCAKGGFAVGENGSESQVIDENGGVKIGGASIATTDRITKIAKVALGAADTGGGVLSWQNPEGTDIIITRIVIDITTRATGACTIDVGTTATSATTSSDNLIDGLDINAATGVFDNIDNKGSNGKSKQKLASGKWVTASKASGSAAGTVGYAYIHYIVI